MLVSIIIPTLNEESSIGATLQAVAKLDGDREVIVVDGGSEDKTIDIAAAASARVIVSPRGRGVQQAAGAKAASGDVLWFLHADSIPPREALKEISATLSDVRVSSGNFRLRFDGDTPSARQLTFLYPYLRLLQLRYGDSGIFATREAYDAAGGFQPYALFEDVDLVRRLKRQGRFVTLGCELTTSSRRFQNRSLAGMFAWWSMLQVLYWAGVHPDRLASLYPPVRARGASGTKK